MTPHLHCDVVAQDCASLYNGDSGYSFQSGSCVNDTRVPGVARCGWPGANCSISNGISNCAYSSTGLCVNQRCTGGVGAPCSFDSQCDGNIRCNGITCGGDNAVYYPLDVPAIISAVCINNVTSTAPNSQVVCGPNGPYLTANATSTTARSTSTSTSHKSTQPDQGILAGALVGAGFVLLLLLLLCIRWCKRRDLRRGENLPGGKTSVGNDPETPLRTMRPRPDARFDNRDLDLEVGGGKTAADVAAQLEAEEQKAQRSLLRAAETLARYRAEHPELGTGKPREGPAPPPYEKPDS